MKAYSPIAKIFNEFDNECLHSELKEKKKRYTSMVNGCGLASILKVRIEPADSPSNNRRLFMLVQEIIR